LDGLVGSLLLGLCGWLARGQGVAVAQNGDQMKAVVIMFLCWSSLAFAEPWDTADKILFGSFLALQAADAAQTHYASRHPDRFREVNPLLGSQPSDGKILAVKSLMIGATYYILKDADSHTRKTVLTVLDALYIGVVAHNASIGVRIGF
jgi:hypothetical protein